MDISLILTIALITSLSFGIFPLLIRTARRLRWVDVPTARRRHSKETPVVGGVGIFALWFLALTTYSLLRPDWFQSHTQSIFVMSGALMALLVVGLVDDLKGLAPAGKLISEFLVAAAVLSLEPEIHHSCVHVIGTMPLILQPLLWAIAAVWLVGAANAVNLIDGIDGFAGGFSLLGLLTVSVLHSLSGGGSGFMTVALALCVPGLAQFLRFNWNPAKIFLGDNGSLTLGFLVAAGGLVPCEPSKAPMSVASLLVLFAYPILDMALCVARRLRCGFPIFKADRSHLHHRVRRLGLSVPQTTILLLCAVSYFQISAVIMHLVHWRLGLLVSVSSVLGLFSLLYLIRCLESWQREMLLNRAIEGDSAPAIAGNSFEIDLRPLLEVGLLEERGRAESLLSTLLSQIRASVPEHHLVSVGDQKLRIHLDAGTGLRDSATETRIREKLASFQREFDLQYSVNGLPLGKKTAKSPAA